MSGSISPRKKVTRPRNGVSIGGSSALQQAASRLILSTSPALSSRSSSSVRRCHKARFELVGVSRSAASPRVAAPAGIPRRERRQAASCTAREIASSGSSVPSARWRAASSGSSTASANARCADCRSDQLIDFWATSASSGWVKASRPSGSAQHSRTPARVPDRRPCRRRAR